MQKTFKNFKNLFLQLGPRIFLKYACYSAKMDIRMLIFQCVNNKELWERQKMH